MTFLEKLEILMVNKNINKRQLSIGSGIPYSTIDNLWKTGYDNIKLSTLKKLSSYFDVSLDFLVRDNIEEPEISEYFLSEHEKALIKAYREHPEIRSAFQQTENSPLAGGRNPQMQEAIRDTLRKNLDYHLKRSGMTQKQLAEKLGISPSAVTNWVKGKNSPDLEYIAIMCDIFHLSISDLLYSDQTKKAPTEELSESDFEKQRLLHNFDRLNSKGRKTLIDYSDDLASMPKYTENIETEVKKQA